MMMKVLIDTHIALLALMNDPKIPKEAEKILMDEKIGLLIWMLKSCL